jgi:methylase of polypeptide subunit release factors
MGWSKPPVCMQHEAQGPAYVDLDYVGKHKAMSSKSLVVELFWQKRQFSFRVNKHIFNPTESYAAYKINDLILSEKIQAADKRIIDLGCGSGIIGICAITKNAKKVLFTNINPHIEGIQKHPLFRKCDEW